MTELVAQVLIAFAYRAEKSKKAVTKAFQPIVISSDDEDEDEDEDDDDDEDDVEATPVPKSKTAAGRRWGARVVMCAVEVLTYREFLRRKQSAGGEAPVSGEAGSAGRRGHRRAAGGRRHEGQHHGLVRGRGGGRG